MMQRKKTTWFFAVLVSVILFGLFITIAEAKSETQSRSKSVYTEEDLGIRNETLYDEDTTVPVHGETTTKEPGESTRIERSFENSPPLIPHDITGMLPLEDDNICSGCHMPEEAVLSGAVPIPSSHLIDLDTGEYLRGKLDGGRFNCMQCHVIQNILAPAVENVFKGEFRDAEGRYRSNLLNILNEGVDID